MFKRVWLWLKPIFSNSQTRLILLMTISIFTIMTTVGFISYYSSMSILRNAISEPQLHLLRIGMDSVDDLVKSADNIAVQVAVNTRTYDFIMRSESSTFDKISSYITYLNHLSSASHLDSIYVYDSAGGRIAASNPYGYSSSLLNFTDTTWLPQIASLDPKAAVVMKRGVGVEGGSGRRTTVSLLRPIMINGEEKGVIVINMKMEQLFSKMNPDFVSDMNSARFILDMTNNPVIQMNNEDLPLEAALSASAQAPDSGTALVTNNKKEYLLTQIRSELTGWSYLSIIPVDKLFKNIIILRNIMFTISLFAVLLGCSALIYFYYLSMKPIKRIRKILENDRKNVGHLGWNEWADFTDKLTKDHKTLASLMKKSQTELQDKLFQDILTGYILDKQIAARWKKYFQDWTDAPLFVMVVSIDHYRQWIMQYKENDQYLMKYAIANMVEEIMSQHARIVGVETEKDSIIFLLQGKQPSFGESSLTEYASEMIRLIGSYLRFEVSIGISSSTDSYLSLHTAYNEALYALSYRVYDGYGLIYFFTSYDDSEYKVQIEQRKLRLTTSIEAGDVEGAWQGVSELVEEFRRDTPPPEQIIAHLDELIHAITPLIREPHKEAFIELGGYSKVFLTTMSLQDIESLLHTVISQIGLYYKERQSSREFDLASQMVSYMKENYGENIGVQDIATAAKVSTSLASQIFKQDMGITLYDYLTQLRIAKAEELLLTTDQKINDIAQQVGYQSENSFIRTFRKEKGITPGKYRMAKRNPVPPS